MVCGEGDVVGGMPVFGGDFEGKWEIEESVDYGDDFAAVWYGKGAILYYC